MAPRPNVPFPARKVAPAPPRPAIPRPVPPAASAETASAVLIWRRLKPVPVFVLVGALALGLKVGDIYQGAENGKYSQPRIPEVGIATARAQAQPAQAPAEVKEEDEEQGGKTDFTRAEVELLQQLSERRAEIDRREKDVEMRDNLLRATEKRIDEKIAELKKIEGRIEALIKKHDEQEEQKIQQVVKIYETMKPKDAAKVLSALDMPILLDIAERMKTAKMASVLAEMDAARAKAVTTELATRRKLPQTGS
ncbi:MAG: hypothetical protein FJX47_18580 [Alphaproteobacteria bacterium]|nr:hypothetical protein [Alphaproteobacteria bacterium]